MAVIQASVWKAQGRRSFHVSATRMTSSVMCSVGPLHQLCLHTACQHVHSAHALQCLKAALAASACPLPRCCDLNLR